MTVRPLPLLSLLAGSLLLISPVLPAAAQQGRGSASARVDVDIGVNADSGSRRRIDERDADYGDEDGYARYDHRDDDGYGYGRDERRPQPGRRFVGGIIGGALGVAGDATRGALSIAGDATRGGIGIARDATRGSIGLARDVTEGTLGAVASGNGAGGRSHGRVLPRGQAGAGVDVRVGVGVHAGAGAGVDDRRRAPYVYRQPSHHHD